MNSDFFVVKDKFFHRLDDSIIKLLLKDKSTKKNIIWATDHFTAFGNGYQLEDEISMSAIKGFKAELIKPRVTKSKSAQAKRIKNKAEVFTPSWVCNNQNNLVDDDWFGRSCVFNQETSHGWVTNPEKIAFPEGKTWMDYDNCMTHGHYYFFKSLKVDSEIKRHIFVMKDYLPEDYKENLKKAYQIYCENKEAIEKRKIEGLELEDLFLEVDEFYYKDVYKVLGTVLAELETNHYV